MTHSTLRSEEMFDFCTQMSMILAGGMSIEEGLEIISEDTANPHMKEAAVSCWKSFRSAVPFTLH